jgi:hypothetical protein
VGVDPTSIQELVGHQSITTTLGVYGHLLLSMQMGRADKLDNFNNLDVLLSKLSARSEKVEIERANWIGKMDFYNFIKIGRKPLDRV